jgi:uncharacterized protein (TIGR02391 family)
MNIQNEIEERTWAAIRPTYEVANYTGAIIAAMQLLSDVIRNKSGLDADGQTLIGQAFEGANPVIKLNALRTESEKDEQKGLAFLLRGLYTGIRNPRSHELKEDSATTAYVLIKFIDWLLRAIDKSRSPFDANTIIERVLDEHFVHTDAYAELLTEEIPPRVRLDILLQLLTQSESDAVRNIRAFAVALLPKLTSNEQMIVCEVLSEKLRTAKHQAEFANAIRLASIDWAGCDAISRLRAENRMVRSIEGGQGISKGPVQQKGWLGLCAKDIVTAFGMRDQLIEILTRKLISHEERDREYVLINFMSEYVWLQPVPPDRVVSFLSHRLKEHDSAVFWGLSFLENPNQHPGWASELHEHYAAFEFGNDIPF